MIKTIDLTPRYKYKARVSRVIDGDTVELIFDLGLKTLTIQKCRLYGINAPEKSTEEGKDSLDFLKYQLQEGATVVVETVKYKRQQWDQMQKEKKGKYGRYLVIIYKEGLKTSVNNLMVDTERAIKKKY